MTDGVPQFSPAYFPDEFDLVELPGFGADEISISWAAELLAVDQWFHGEYPEIKEPENWDGAEFSPQLRKLLEDKAGNFQSRILRSLAAGEIRAAYVRRFENDQVDPNRTFLSRKALYKWVDERNIELGDVFNNWESDIADTVLEFAGIASRVHARATLSRAERAELGPRSFKDIQTEFEELQLKYAKLLSDQHTAAHMHREPESSRPLSTRERNTLLTMIGALCKEAGIDTTERGAATRLEVLCQGLGAKISHTTISSKLKLIPDALESRLD